jgi:two-component SAPR family response regulator
LRNLNKNSNAEKILKNLQETIIKRTSKYELGLWHLEWGFVYLIQKSLKQAQKSFQAARDIFVRGRRPYEKAKALLGLCLTANTQRDMRSLKGYLADLSRILTEVETIQPLLPEFSYHREGIKQLVVDCQLYDSLEFCLDEIDRYLKGLPEAQVRIYPQPAGESEIPKLEIRGFGEIIVSWAGKRITASEWIHQKTVREILFYLLSHPRGVTKEQVGLSFWPDSSPSQLSCQFKNAMYRLRRAIGVESILFHQESRSYSFNWDSQYNYDVEDFLEALKLADSQPNANNRIDHLRRAVSIYKHPFAPQLDGIWAEPVRHKLYLDYEKAQLEIATYDLSMSNYSACRDACLAVLETEPCQEMAYQLCMEAYSSLNNITEIRRLFKSCEKNFHMILGIRPSNITINLYKKLTAK